MDAQRVAPSSREGNRSEERISTSGPQQGEGHEGRDQDRARVGGQEALNMSISMEVLPQGSPLDLPDLRGGSEGRMKSSILGWRATPLERSRLQTRAQEKLRKGQTDDALKMHDALHADRIRSFQRTLDGTSAVPKSVTDIETGAGPEHTPAATTVDNSHAAEISEGTKKSPSQPNLQSQLPNTLPSPATSSKVAGEAQPGGEKGSARGLQLGVKGKGESVIELLKTVKVCHSSSANCHRWARLSPMGAPHEKDIDAEEIDAPLLCDSF